MPTITPAKLKIKSLLAAKGTSKDKPVTGRANPILRSDGHLYVNSEGTWAAFRLGGINYDAMTSARFDDLLADMVERVVDLTGKRVWLRGTSAPWDAHGYIHALYQSNRNPLPDRPDGMPLADLAESAAALPVALGCGHSVVVMAVLFTTRRVEADHLRYLIDDVPPPAGLGLVEADRQALRAVTRTVEAAGLSAKRLTTAGLQWVHETSAALGHTPARIGDVTSESVLASPARVRHGVAPRAATVPVRVIRDTGIDTVHVCVRHVGTIPPRDSRETRPFLGDLNARRVEWVATFDVISGEDLEKEAGWQLKVANDTEAHDREHDVDPGEGVKAGIARAREYVTEVTHGDAATATRVWGRIMVATASPLESEGGTPQDAIDAANELATITRRSQRVQLLPDWGMDADVWKFCPGEPWGKLDKNTGHIRRFPARMLAVLGPAVTGQSGDQVGFMVGAKAGSAEPYVWDSHGGPQNNKNGVTLLIGDQGSGKTMFGSRVLHWDVRWGRRGLAFDPTSRLASLATLPDLKDDTVVFPLTEGSKPGLLMPHYLDPEPLSRNYDSQEEWEAAVDSTRAARIARMIDATVMCLPHSYMSNDRGDLLAVIEAAAATVGGAYGTHSQEMIDALKKEGGRGPEIARLIERRKALGAVRLVFPGQDVSDSILEQIGADAALTIVTIPRIQMPRSADRSTWTRQQQDSTPIFGLGFHLAARSIWSDSEPKTFLADEMMTMMSGYSSMQTDTLRLVTESRKFDLAMILASQATTAYHALDDEVEGLAGTVALFRTARKVASSAMRLMRNDPESHLVDLATRLRTGELIISGWDGVPAHVVADLSWSDENLLRVLNTTPPERNATVQDRLT